MHKQTDIFYSIPEVWDFCLEKIYNKKTYVSGFIKLLNKQGVNKQSTILDAGCGSGFPAIDLIEKGYRVICTDKSSEMVRQVQLNAKKRGISIEAYHVMWSNLAKQFDNIFDFVYCRGNSLVYAASWEQNWIVPSRSRDEIFKAIQNFYNILKPKGKVYIDITNKNEKPHKEDIGTVHTKNGPVSITWEISHDIKNKIRAWTINLKFLKARKERTYHSYSYFMPHEELIDFLYTAGFRKIDKYMKVKGENNYNVFIGYK